jgi:tetratricopeptide (TPR) repeat protein
VAADLHASRGACFFHLRLYADAVADTTRALKISPGNATALVHRAKAYAATGQQKKAKADAAAALASDPSDDDAKATMDALEPKKAGVRLLPIRPRSRGARRSLRTFPVVTLHPRFPFNV